MSNNFSERLNKSIDFNSVLSSVAQYASFSCSKQEILSSLPNLSLIEIQRQGTLIQEAIDYLQSGAILNMAGCSDVSTITKKASKRMTLSAKELLDVASFLVSCRSVQNALHSSETTELKDLAESMDVCPNLINQIHGQIDLTGSVKEDATPLLRSKHHELLDVRVNLQKKSRAFLKKHSARLMENMTTSISGRVSVLVKASEKNSFGGMVHGSSQSGLAYYIEPAEFVEDNNRIQMIQVEIEEEKLRICKELSKLVAQKAFSIESNLQTMTLLDTCFCKGKWAIAFDGCVPMVHTRDHSMLFENARHPLLKKETVVANTYSLKANQYCLMISGPNMGGKSVTLKTIGLFVALTHAGFPLSCHRAHVPYYHSLFFDIGDNQSIENNLSTFSSHISNLSKICSQCDENSFILLDEVGNGTDPLEGASLATAILEFLIQKKCTIVTSTHYNQVKAFGKANPHVLVSSVEFDGETLKPTYRYIPGVSGASYAFNIASQYNLDPWILNKANTYKEENIQQHERELEKLEKLQEEVLQEKERFQKLIQEAHRIQKEAMDTKAKWEKKKEELDTAYQQELNEMLDAKKEEAQQILADLRKQQTSQMHKQIEKVHALNELYEENEEEEIEQKETLKVGDYVRVKNLNSHGEIVDIRKNQAVVNVNGMKMKLKLNQLTKMVRPNVEKVKIRPHVDRTFKRFPLELNIIGMRVEEGLDALDHYLDQAVANRIKQVRIVHGMGTGALRSAVWKDLDKHPHVKGKTSAGPNEGGLGATIVVLK
ncbi:MAG: endonuclease MutS2 [Bacillota bacterium]|nr:endonuclease MutS2 [Bacillota bacterium]